MTDVLWFRALDVIGRLSMSGIRDHIRKKQQLSTTVPDRCSESRSSKTGVLGNLSGLLLSRICKEGPNPVISPSCLYQMLTMLADISSGDTREQIISVLGDEQAVLSTLDEIASIDVSDHGCKDFHYSIGASLWLDERIRMNDRFREKKHLIPLDLERVPLGSEIARASMDKWLSDNTGGIFESASESQDGDLLVGLTAMHLKDSWSDEFQEEGQRAFKLDNGTKIDANFMLGRDSYDLLERDGAMTLSKDLSSGCFMVISIPPMGTSLETYIASGQAWQNMDAYASGECTEEGRECRLHLPKFELLSDKVDLVNALQGIGISKIFGSDADFSALSNDALMVNCVQQGTRLSIDEQGLEGASYVAVMFFGCASPDDLPEPREIVFDRPFVVSVFAGSKRPLFVGVVTCPK